MTSVIEDLSPELFMSIFDYLTTIEILISFYNLNKRIRLIIYNYLQTDNRLIKFNLIKENYLIYKIFLNEILSNIKSTITSLKLGSIYFYEQLDYFNQYQLIHLDSLTIRLINSNKIIQILQNFLNYNRLQWFDQIHLIIDEQTIGWNEELPFCVQDIPVRQLKITGKAPYQFAQHLMTGCYSLTYLTIHLKYDHDLLPLLYYLPNLIECNASVDDRGRDISQDINLLERLPSLKYFKYEGLMPFIYLRRLIIKINEQIKELYLSTQDYQTFDGFSFEFFQNLTSLKIFHFYLRLITSNVLSISPSYLTDMKYLINRNLCENIGWILSKDIGQIFSLPFAFNKFEIFDKNFFYQIQYFDLNTGDYYWNNIQYLTIHNNIYDPSLLKLIENKFPKLRSIDYQVPHVSLIPQDNEFYQYDTQFNRIKILKIRNSVKHGCHIPQPFFLLTTNLIELDIEHFYLMQILSISSQQIQTKISIVFNRLQSLTVRQFDERLTEYFFSYFSHINILSLIFLTYKMQIYRTKFPFLDNLLHSIPNLISFKFEHIKKPHDYNAVIEMKKNIEDTLSKYYLKDNYSCKWYDDHTQKYEKYATLFFST